MTGTSPSDKRRTGRCGVPEPGFVELAVAGPVHWLVVGADGRWGAECGADVSGAVLSVSAVLVDCPLCRPMALKTDHVPLETITVVDGG